MQAHAQSAETSGSSSSRVAGELPALELKSSSALQESYPQEVRDQQPIYIKGDSLSGQPDIKASVHGEAEPAPWRHHDPCGQAGLRGSG